MKTKIYLLWLALMVSLCSLFAQNTPTVEDLQNYGFDTENQLVLCFKFPEPSCYEIVLYGSYNNWSENIENMSWFWPFEGFDGWYVTYVDNPGSNVEAKPIHLVKNNEFNWKYQAGDKNAWVYVAGEEADVQNSSIQGEPRVVFPHAGAYIYEMNYWKSHVDPCNDKPKYNYTINLYAPYVCEGITPAIQGDFNNWAEKLPMTPAVDEQSRTYYTITIEASEEDRYNFYGLTSTEAYLIERSTYWGEWTQTGSYTLYSTRTVTHDWSNVFEYRFHDCTPPDLEQVTVSVLVPTDCGLDVSDGLYLCWWPNSNTSDQHIVKMTAGEGRKFNATFSPGDYAYGCYFLNKPNTGIENCRQTTTSSPLTAESVCFEIAPAWEESEPLGLIEDMNCSRTDHDRRPTNLHAVNVGLDTVLFSWEAPDDVYSYSIYAFDANHQELFSFMFSSYELQSNQYRYKVGNASPMEVAYWTLTTQMNLDNRYMRYSATGEAFSVAGDARLPHNLSIVEKSEGVYTFAWESAEGVDHFRVEVQEGTYLFFDNISEHAIDLTLDDNNNYRVIVYAQDANGNDLGNASISFNTYKVDARDIPLHFYIPSPTGFLSANGGAILWRDGSLTGEHLLPLTADEGGHWFKATIPQYTREHIYFKLLNAETAEAATQMLSFSESVSNEAYFILQQTQDKQLILTNEQAQDIYPHNYAITSVSAEQELNRMILSWTAEEYSPSYEVVVTRLDGSTWSNTTSDHSVVYNELSNADSITLDWRVTPSSSNGWWDEMIRPLTVYSQFKAGPSPFLAKNLKAVANEDGTFTFSWSPVTHEAVKSYLLTIINPGKEFIVQETTRDTTITRTIPLLFSGKFVMRVKTYDENYNTLGEVADTFIVAPVQSHDIKIRVMMNPLSEYDLSEGLQFRIRYSYDSIMRVDATQEKYGWWSYTLTTNEYGARFGLWNDGGTVTVYADTCLEYKDGFIAVDCDARATDYFPHHLNASPNGDGTYTISWLMDRTDRVRKYRVDINNVDSGWGTSIDDIQALQCRTPLLPQTGKYGYRLIVNDQNDEEIAVVTDTFVIEPLPEREIVLRVLEEYIEQGWVGAQIYNNWSSYRLLNIRDELDEEGNPTSWCCDTIRTTEPAVRIYLQSRWNQYTEFWLAKDTCLRVHDGFQEVNCDAHAPDYAPFNLQAESLGNGRVRFSWATEDTPDAFYLQTAVIDTVKQDTTYLTYNYYTGDTRWVTASLNLDTTAFIGWYLMSLMQRNDKYYYVAYEWGPSVTVEPAIYAPQNLQLKANIDGTYTASWEAPADTVVQYAVRLRKPNGENQSYVYTTETVYTTPLLTDLGTYQIYVYSLNREGISLGWQSVTFQVEELEEARDMTVRVLLHPDANRTSLGYIQVQRNEDGNSYLEKVYDNDHTEGDPWYTYTFSSKWPVQKIRMYGRDQYITGDACFDYVKQIEPAACDAEPHDYRIIENSLKTVSEEGKVTFSWSALNKSEQYEIHANYYKDDEISWLFSQTVTDTCFVFIVPSYVDGGQVVQWSVRPKVPFELDEVISEEPAELQTSKITIYDLEVTSSDSISYHFTWKANTDTIQYEIRINQNYYYSSYLQQQVATTAFDHEFISSSVSYTWSVRAVNANGEPLSVWKEAEDGINVKKGLRAITNLQGSAQGDIVTFTWDAKTPAVGARLGYTDQYGWWNDEISQDSLLFTNSFSYKTKADGRYGFTLTPYVEIEGVYVPLDEYAYITTNVFMTKTYNVSISTTTGGHLNSDPSGVYPEGYELWIDAQANEHYRFVAWSDGVTDLGRSIIVTSDTTLIAFFEPKPEHTVTLTAAEGGYLSVWYNGEHTETSLFQTTVEDNEWLSVIAVPAEGYTFLRWSDGQIDREIYVQVNKNIDLTALFAPTYKATITAAEGGRVLVSGGEYDKTTKQYACVAGTELNLRADPDEDYRFTGWSDGDANVSRTVIITSDTTIQALFASIETPLQQFVVRVLSDNIELGEVSNNSGTYYEGDHLTITATPKEYATFVRWSDGDLNATRVITVSQDTTLTAFFDYKYVSLTLQASEGGQVNADINGIYIYGTPATIQAQADQGFRFVEWSDGSTEAWRYITLTQDTVLTAYFAVEQFLVTFLNADGSYIESNYWNYGQTPTCSLIPTLPPTEEFEFEFIGWTPEIVPVTGNAIYTATYNQVPVSPSALEELIESAKGQTLKFIHNGQFFILRDGHLYTITGQKVQ